MDFYQIQFELDRQLQGCPSKAATVLGLGYEEVFQICLYCCWGGGHNRYWLKCDYLNILDLFESQKTYTSRPKKKIVLFPISSLYWKSVGRSTIFFIYLNFFLLIFKCRLALYFTDRNSIQFSFLEDCHDYVNN